ncbi:hypothetical protein AOA12_10270 [Microbacterium sp. No. 7]|nr:hypothetical protein AOA12_10270 [Microbacterium sp. No. 7]
MRDAESAGDLSDACSLACRDQSRTYLVVVQRPETNARVNASGDEPLPNRLDMDPMLLRDLNLSQTVRVVGHKRRK